MGLDHPASGYGYGAGWPTCPKDPPSWTPLSSSSSSSSSSSCSSCCWH